MGSTEQDASKSDFKAKDGLDQGTASAADRPSLMSPPQRPVRPVRPAAAPEAKTSVAKTSAVGVKVAPKAPAAEPANKVAVAEPPAPDPAAYRYQPIAPPSEPMQYRAIGLVRGTYEPSEADQLNRGNLTTEDGHVIDSVLLGRITSLVKKHIDLAVPHLWVVYPRTRRELDNDDQDLHLQIVGVWEPETLGLPGEAPANADDDTDEAAADADKPDLKDLPPVDDNFFSIRGEVVKYTPEDQCIAVKILQGVKRTPGSSKPFKLLLHGTIEGRTVGYFWDFKVRREAKVLVVSEATMVGIVPPKKRAKGSGGGGGPRRGGGRPSMRSGPGGSRPPMPNRRPTGVKGSDAGAGRPASRPKKRDENLESSPE
ncbi:hypothetical protein IQ265_25550 [Nodosilinea sp. LEGE 06152]|uniref:hypothetical protein n=1 Tax=Nodosilinea sp. LEGE 06152 TaxID=2777966 RepID=UPI0018800727|nr:hypothetical protein [Nodosilinea sp. LEGE 06152]MBE9160164.1 hypothetical protein [Nodosilinea sp. LEGE 06152]